MMDRDTIYQAALAMEGVAVLLPPCWDFALAGYTVVYRIALALYDYSLAIEGMDGSVDGRDYDPEDHLLDDMRDCMAREGVKPLLIHMKGG